MVFILYPYVALNRRIEMLHSVDLLGAWW